MALSNAALLAFGGTRLVARAGKTRRALQAAESQNPLSTGLWSGRIEGGLGPAARIEVRHIWLRNPSGAGRWVACGRYLDIRPFDLVLDDRKRVRVEPGKGAFLVGALTELANHDTDQYLTVAEVATGDRVHVRGQLIGDDASYRSAAPTIVAADDGPLEIWLEKPVSPIPRRLKTAQLVKAAGLTAIGLAPVSLAIGSRAVWDLAMAVLLLVYMAYRRHLANHPVVARLPEIDEAMQRQQLPAAERLPNPPALPPPPVRPEDDVVHRVLMAKASRFK